MNELTPEEQVDWSEIYLGEDNEIIGYVTPEDADEFFSDPKNEIKLEEK
jgi:hypothetical protein